MTSQQKSSLLHALDRRRFIQFSAGSLALAATGCDRRKESAQAGPFRVIVGVPGPEELQLDAQQLWLTSMPLMAMNEKGEYEGRLSERWEHSPDFREPYPERLPALEYPGHFLVKRVTNAGTFRLKHKLLFIANALKQHHLGLEETDDGIWSIYFGSVLLAKVDEREMIIRD